MYRRTLLAATAAVAALPVLRPRRAAALTTYQLTQSLLLANDTVLDLTGKRLVWAGPVGGAIFASDPSAPLQRASVIGGAIDPGSAGYGFSLHSPQNCTFRAEFLPGTAAFTAMRIATDAQTPKGYETTKNAVYNRVDLIAARCGVLLELVSQAGSYITLNQFDRLVAGGDGGGLYGKGVVIRQPGWVDSNVFSFIRLALGGQNAVGIDLGDTGTPQGVYDNVFNFVDVDAWVQGQNCIGIDYHGLDQHRNPVLGPTSPWNGAGIALGVKA